jgi:hypothetical protein
VLALRLYTTAAYKSLNAPLREHASRSGPHAFPVTVTLIAEGLKRLRTVAAQQDGAHTAGVLWRGVRNVLVVCTRRGPNPHYAYVVEVGSERGPEHGSALSNVAHARARDACAG